MVWTQQHCNRLAAAVCAAALISAGIALATSVSPPDATAMNAMMKEAREHPLRLRQRAEQTRAEADERLTRELIAEYRRRVASLEDAMAFWLEILRDSLEATSRGGKA